MKVSITFRHMEPSDILKQYVTEKLDKLDKLVRKPTEAHVVLSVEKHNRIADVTLSAKDLTARGEAVSDDMRASIDGAVKKVEKTLARHKEKKTSKNRAQHHETERIVST